MSHLVSITSKAFKSFWNRITYQMQNSTTGYSENPSIGISFHFQSGMYNKNEKILIWNCLTLWTYYPFAGYPAVPAAFHLEFLFIQTCVSINFERNLVCKEQASFQMWHIYHQCAPLIIRLRQQNKLSVLQITLVAKLASHIDDNSTAKQMIGKGTIIRIFSKINLKGQRNLK